MPSLEEFPDEIIRHILLYLPPEDTLRSFQLLSRRLHYLANESLLWRWYCRISFKYWHPGHRFQEKLAVRASSVDWKRMWLARKRSNNEVARLLDGVLSTKVGQLRRLQQICQMGYDVKDYLLDQCHIDDSAEDALARRYEKLFPPVVRHHLISEDHAFRRCLASLSFAAAIR